MKATKQKINPEVFLRAAEWLASNPEHGCCVAIRQATHISWNVFERYQKLFSDLFQEEYHLWYWWEAPQHGRSSTHNARIIALLLAYEIAKEEAQ